MSKNKTDIREYATRTWEDFQSRQKSAEDRFKLGLSQQTVENLLHSAFYASMQSDEDRYPCVTIMCYKDDYAPAPLVELSYPIDVTSDQLAKLSHAVSRDSHIICTANNGSLTISGIAVNELDDQRGFGFSSGRIGNPLKVTIRGPGYVEVSSSGTALVYNAGIVSEETLLSACRAMEKLEKSVEVAVRGLSTLVESVPLVFNHLIKSITRLGHGGMVLFAAEQKEEFFSSLRRSDSTMLRILLLRYWNAARKVMDRVRQLGFVEAIVSIGNTEEGQLLSANTAMLERALGELARLSGMDGALAFHYSCSLFAFNAIIKKAASNFSQFRLLNEKLMPTTYDEVTANRGSRHQAALSYVMTVPDSIAFVVSQDSQVSAFHRADETTVVCERNMRVLE